MPISDCRHFSGYKPCGKNSLCDLACPHLDRPAVRLLMIHLGAMGAVVRATALLAAMKRKYPSSHLTWVTDDPMPQLLRGHPWIDRVLTPSTQDQLILRALKFDVAFVLDKSLVAAGLLGLTRADLVYGFVADSRTGAVVPASPAAAELWELGLDDHRKFFVNQKTENQLQHEALDLGPYLRDEYNLHVTAKELQSVQTRKQAWTLRCDQPVIGFNTGCGPLMPAKKWTTAKHRDVIVQLLNQGHQNLVLLGGPEDSIRNQQIADGLPVVVSATDQGVRDGLISVGACDLVVTGDSFGMHLAIALRKYVIAWFGPSCAHEIDLYGRGIRLRSTLGCDPCWNRDCAKSQMCYDHVQNTDIMNALTRGMDWLQPMHLKRPMETCPF